MPRKRHTEEQIVYALRQGDAGKKVGDICREMGVSQQAVARRDSETQDPGGGSDFGQR